MNFKPVKDIRWNETRKFNKLKKKVKKNKHEKAGQINTKYNSRNKSK